MIVDTNLVSGLLARIVVADDIAGFVRAIIDVYDLARTVRHVITSTANRPIFDLVTNLQYIQKHTISRYISQSVLKGMNILCIRPFFNDGWV